jgi:predicted transposase YbfD/YdcC
VIRNTGNNYVIAVKKNQPSLHRQIHYTATHSNPISRYTETEKTRNRVTNRTVTVFNDVNGIDQAWVGLQSLIKVEKSGTRAGKPYHQIVYYISSLTCSAVEFAHGIRGHWGIENRLHWVKDMVFDEDRSRIRKGNASANRSIILALTMNILRRNGYSSITSAHRFISNDIDKLLLLVE